MNLSRSLFGSIVTCAAWGLCALAPASAGAANLLVMVTGNGGGAGANTPSQISLLDLASDGTSIGTSYTNGTWNDSTYVAPSTGVNLVTGSPTWTTFGQLSLSGDGKSVSFAGTGAALGGSYGTDRVIGNYSIEGGTFDTSTRFSSSSAHTGGFIRGVYTEDGSGYWFTGNGSSNHSVGYVANGGSSTTAIATNFGGNALGMYDGTLYISRATGSGYWGPGVFGTNPGVNGLTESGGSYTRTATTDYSDNTGETFDDFAFVDAATMLVANSAAGELQLYAETGGVWALDQQLTVGDVKHLDFYENGDELQIFYVTGTGTAISTISSVTYDKVAQAWGTSELLETVELADGYTFGGLALYAIPEPASAALIMGGALLVFVGCRRRSALRY